jgi:hypothetical protein
LTPISSQILTDCPLRLCASGATTHFSNTTGKWQLGQAY